MYPLQSIYDPVFHCVEILQQKIIIVYLFFLDL